MSSDYRPRGGRRRRGGKSRPGQSGSRFNEKASSPQSGGSLFTRLFGWMFSKKKKKTETEVEKKVVVGKSSRPATPKEERAPKVQSEEKIRPEFNLSEITSPKLYVGNLAYEAAESDLFDLFSKVGAVKNVEIAMDRQSKRSKGFGFVEMESLETAKEASSKLNRTDFLGRKIMVSGAKTDKRLSEARTASPITEESTI